MKTTTRTLNPCPAPGCPGCPTLPGAVQARLLAYAAPTTLSAEAWAGLRDRVVCLVRRTRPGSPHTARSRLSALCAFLAAADPGPERPLASVLTLPRISAFLASRRGEVSARQLANLAAMLERARCTAHGIPYRASNTADPGARSARQRNKHRPEPTEANAALIASVCAARPVLASIVEGDLTNHRLEHIQPHLPRADLAEHHAVLRGPAEESSPQVWHRAAGTAQAEEKATEGKDL
ncbi:MAG: hypothetical protein E6Q90_00785 [Actinobacteria bacterium]|nr:MAG: hypothetical protein E6Q90_00785 [Actinomycetota bacterium]